MSGDFTIRSSSLPVLNTLGRYDPEPKNSLATGAKKFMEVLGGVASGSVRGLTGLTGGAGLNEVTEEIDQIFSPAMEAQLYWQTQMQMVSLLSNSQKSEHECYMVPLRNISVR